MYTYARANMQTCTHIRTYACTCAHTHTHTHKHTHIYTYKHLCTHVCMIARHLYFPTMHAYITVQHYRVLVPCYMHLKCMNNVVCFIACNTCMICLIHECTIASMHYINNLIHCDHNYEGPQHSKQRSSGVVLKIDQHSGSGCVVPMTHTQTA